MTKERTIYDELTFGAEVSPLCFVDPQKVEKLRLAFETQIRFRGWSLHDCCVESVHLEKNEKDRTKDKLVFKVRHLI